MNSKKITLGLLIFYLLILTWIILFKLSFSINELPHIRNINLIPFGQSLIVNGTISYTEIIQNMLAFIPFGIFVYILWDKKTFIIKLIPIVLTSLIFEVIQYICAIGASDITDLLANSLGGIIGLLTAFVITKVFKNPVKVINIVCLVFASLLTLLIGILILANI